MLRGAMLGNSLVFRLTHSQPATEPHLLGGTPYPWYRTRLACGWYFNMVCAPACRLLRGVALRISLLLLLLLLYYFKHTFGRGGTIQRWTLTVNCGWHLQACMAQCTEVLTAGEEATQKGDLEVVQANHSTSQ